MHGCQSGDSNGQKRVREPYPYLFTCWCWCFKSHLVFEAQLCYQVLQLPQNLDVFVHSGVIASNHNQLDPWIQVKPLTWFVFLIFVRKFITFDNYPPLPKLQKCKQTVKLLFTSKQRNSFGDHTCWNLEGMLSDVPGLWLQEEGSLASNTGLQRERQTPVWIRNNK